MDRLHSPFLIRIKRRVRRMTLGQPVVVVSGLPRSGTSMMMSMLEKGGLSLVEDEMRTADQDNPEGYHEFEPVKNLADSDDKSWVEKSRGKGVKIISELLKELPREHYYQVIFMRRRLSEIIASQNKMLVHRQEPTDPEKDEQISTLFERHLWTTRRWLRLQPNFEVLELRYARVLTEPLKHARAVSEFLGTPLQVEAMASVVDPSLYRNRMSG